MKASEFLIVDNPSMAHENAKQLAMAKDAVVLDKPGTYHLAGGLPFSGSLRLIGGKVCMHGDVYNAVGRNEKAIYHAEGVEFSGQGKIIRGLDTELLVNKIELHGCKFTGATGFFVARFSHTKDPNRFRTGFMDGIRVHGVTVENNLGSVVSVSNGAFDRYEIKNCTLVKSYGVAFNNSIWRPDDADPMPVWLLYDHRKNVIIQGNKASFGKEDFDWPAGIQGVYQVPWLFEARDVLYEDNEVFDMVHSGKYEMNGVTKNRFTAAEYLTATMVTARRNKVRNVGNRHSGITFMMGKGGGPGSWTKGFRQIEDCTFDNYGSLLPPGKIMAYYEPLSHIVMDRCSFGDDIEVSNTPIRVRNYLRLSRNSFAGRVSGVLRVANSKEPSELVVETDKLIPMKFSNPWDGVNTSDKPGYPPKEVITLDIGDPPDVINPPAEEPQDNGTPDGSYPGNPPPPEPPKEKGNGLWAIIAIAGVIVLSMIAQIFWRG